MPNYEFEYTHESGEKVRIERFFRMRDCPETITVEENGVTYIARKVISLNADMSGNWNKWYEPSDLPPVNHPPIE